MHLSTCAQTSYFIWSIVDVTNEYIDEVSYSEKLTLKTCSNSNFSLVYNMFLTFFIFFFVKLIEIKVKMHHGMKILKLLPVDRIKYAIYSNVNKRECQTAHKTRHDLKLAPCEWVFSYSHLPNGDSRWITKC